MVMQIKQHTKTSALKVQNTYYNNQPSYRHINNYFTQITTVYLMAN